MANKDKRPAWFKMFRYQKDVITAASDEIAGKALKAAFMYFEDGETVPEMDTQTFIVFSALKPYIDASYEDYKASVDHGKAGAAVRYGKDTGGKV